LDYITSMTPDIVILLVILAALVVLFVTELFRVDVVALICMLSLVWTGLLSPSEAFSGFSGSAVISVIAVMILGHGIELSGIMRRVARPIVSMAGKSESRLTVLVSLTAGAISSFMQNIGAAALFLPALRRISRDAEIPVSRLLMPMGFAAILGGTLTMVGSGPLILLNDLLDYAHLQPFGLFGSSPVGIVLLAVGVLYFLLIGKRLLPRRSPVKLPGRSQKKLMDSFHLDATVYMMCIPPESDLVGKTRDESGLCKDFGVNLLAIAEEDEVIYAPWRMTHFAAGQSLALFGNKEDVDRFYKGHNLTECYTPDQFNLLIKPESAGFAEIIVLPGSDVVNKTLRQIALRKHFNVEPVMMLKGSEEIRGDFSDISFEPGDIIIVYGLWDEIRRFKESEDFVVSSDLEGKTPPKYSSVKIAVIMAGVLASVIIGISLPVALMTGVIAMLLTNVITMDEAYKSVDWRTVFLIAGLIPLGIAMEKTGAAQLIAAKMMAVIGDSHTIVIMFAVGVLTTVFTLFMSNVAATVLLVPLVINIAHTAAIPAAPMALLVALCTSNSFLLPTHQVNAFLMAPGGYKTKDYIKTGGLMTIIFLIVCVGLMYALYIL
jgi:di/tricarboxylate transporter